MRKNFFFCAITVAVTVLTACQDIEGNTDLDVRYESTYESIYSIKIVLIPVEGKDLSKEADAYTNVKKTNNRQTVTLTVIPPETVDEAEHYYVEKIEGSYSKGGNTKSFSGFTPSNTNEWTFRMPDGDLTITITFTDKPYGESAYLESISASSGTISPEFRRDTLKYKITVPYDVTELSIYAQAENPNSTLELWENSTDLKKCSFDESLNLTEGLNLYTISVTSQDKENTEEYIIDIILLPNLTLKTLQINNNGETVQNLLLDVSPQTVFVPYTEGSTVVFAEAYDVEADVDIDPVAIDSNEITNLINTSIAKEVTVTVSKTLESEKYSKDYILELYYRESMAPPHLAEGGYISFIPADGVDAYYEVHTFMETGYLLFDENMTWDVAADILVVAGGGGGGGTVAVNSYNQDYGGGGGAGGLLYRTGQILPTGSPILIKVGNGGLGGGVVSPGNNGEESAIGDIAIAPGGGGGGGGGSNITNADILNGKPGGSGGGGGAGYRGYYGKGGNSTVKALQADLKGNSGGNSGTAGQIRDSGGGGGGAGGNGKAPSHMSKNPGQGGDGWKPSGDWAWVKLVTETEEFARGGDGGCENNESTAPGGVAGANYGNGGGGASKGACFGNGAAGIVIIRFLYQSNGTE
ncbi:MAG: cadherin-like beta sandwich domain-containing protein [Spirochaetaceae bacterium]|nr:cadherin-like beta sandwich domain-containing protein [Spirochaetaceae bacterium]